MKKDQYFTVEQAANKLQLDVISFLQDFVLNKDMPIYFYVGQLTTLQKGFKADIEILLHSYIRDLVQVDPEFCRECILGRQMEPPHFGFDYQGELHYGTTSDVFSFLKCWVRKEDLKRFGIEELAPAELLYDGHKNKVYAGGRIYSLNSQNQIKVFKYLYKKCVVEGYDFVKNAEMVNEIGGNLETSTVNPNIQDIFKGNPILGPVIIKGERGLYGLV